MTVAENYTALDNLQWTVGKHSFTFGGPGRLDALQRNQRHQRYKSNYPDNCRYRDLGNQCIEQCATPKYAATSGTGLSYASFLVGEIDKGSFTQYLQQEFGARFRAISPYAQDTGK